MKRVNLIRHLEKNGCIFLREGAKHTLYINPTKNKMSSIPRHSEIKENLTKKICKDLDITLP